MMSDAAEEDLQRYTLGASSRDDVWGPNGLRHRRESQKRKGFDLKDGDKTSTFAREELEDLSVDSGSESELDYDTMTPEEVTRRRQLQAIRRNAENLLRTRTLHSKAVLRPYTMSHHIALSEMGAEESDELAYEAISSRARTEALIVFIFYGAVIVTLRVIVLLLSLYIETIKKYPTWNLFTRAGWFDIVRSSGVIFRKSLTNWWISNHSSLSMCLKTFIFVVVLFSTAHRIIGWALSAWLFNLIGTPKGAFMMTFGGVTLRLGLVYNDHNEIEVTNFVWHNTPRFKETPYFGKIRSLRLKFCLLSVIDAFRYRTPIRINEFVIDGLILHIERGKRQADGLNLWSVLGADSVEDSAQVKEGVLDQMAKAAAGATSGAKSMGKGVVTGVYSGAKGTASTAYRGVKMVGGVAMHYNPVTMGWQAMHSSKTSDDNEKANHHEEPTENGEAKQCSNEEEDEDYLSMCDEESESEVESSRKMRESTIEKKDEKKKNKNKNKNKNKTKKKEKGTGMRKANRL